MTTEQYIHGQIFEVQLANIIPKHNAEHYRLTELAALIESIENLGLLQPILVTSTPDGLLKILDGDKRWYAAQYTALTSVQIKFIAKNTEIISITANMLRSDIPPIEKAELMQKLKTQFSYSNEDLARMINRSAPTVCEILSLNNLTAKIKQICRNDRMFSHSLLMKIAKIKNKQEMESAFFKLQNKMMAQGGNGRTAIIDNGEKKVQRLIKTINNVISEFGGLDLDELSPLLKSDMHSAFNNLVKFCKRYQNRFS